MHARIYAYGEHVRLNLSAMLDELEIPLLLGMGEGSNSKLNNVKVMFMLKAYLMPHPPLIINGIGKGTEILDTRRACEFISAEIKKINPETVIFISPHGVIYNDRFYVYAGLSANGNFGAFGAEHIKFSVEYDSKLAACITENSNKQNISTVLSDAKTTDLDHGVMVPLYFLNTSRIVRISFSGLSLEEHYRFGMSIQKAVSELNRNAVIVASGDMSHRLKADGPYGFAEEGPEYDEYVKNCILNSDFKKLLSIDPGLCEKAAECGLRSLVIAAGAMDGMKVDGRILSYEGPYGVGYLTAAFTADNEAPSLFPENSDKITEYKNFLLNLVKQNVENYVRTNKKINVPENVPPIFLENCAGTFVSIKKDGNLRGCIGTIFPTQKNIVLEVLENSVSAATRDPRFEPITTEEFDSLTYSVDILSPPEPVNSAQELDVKRYGVIVAYGSNRGLLLPNLEGVETVEKQISIALKKGNISPDVPYIIERFEVTRYK